LLRKEIAMDYGGSIGERKDVATFLQIFLTQYKITVLYRIKTSRSTDVKPETQNSHHPLQ
jgi:hypothetical protein